MGPLSSPPSGIWAWGWQRSHCSWRNVLTSMKSLIFLQKKDQDQWNYEIAKVPIIIETLKHVSTLAYSHFIPLFNINSMKSWMMEPKFVLSHEFLSVHHEYFVGTFASILLCPPLSNVWLRYWGPGHIRSIMVCENGQSPTGKINFDGNTLPRASCVAHIADHAAFIGCVSWELWNLRRILQISKWFRSDALRRCFNYVHTCRKNPRLSRGPEKSLASIKVNKST